MSSGGDIPVLTIAGVHADAAERALSALATITEALADATRRVVLVGGIAVMARVGAAERATGDLDTAIDTSVEAIPTVALLKNAKIAVSSGPQSPQRVVVDGVPVDVIDTAPVLDDLDHFDGADRLFLGGHRYAVETAEMVRLRAGAVMCDAYLATGSALIATKLHPVLYRRADAQHKAPSDVFDLYRLLDAVDWTAAAAQLTEVDALARAVMEGLQQALVENALRAARHLAVSGSPTMAPITADMLAAVGAGFAETIRELLE